ncbi:MAG: right-handed parallel beta-helix repeat-containing protein, partial [Candidatus Thorarchaeota archaeon]
MRKDSLFLVIILIVGFLAGNQKLVVVENEYNTSLIQLQENQALADFIPDDPLTIVGNTELASAALAESWLGNGTASNPFIIEGYSFFNDTITMSPTYHLSISNTSYYLKIRNCSFVWGRPFNYVRGITLDNVTNTIITNCSFTHLETGIRIQNSSRCTVRNITCMNIRVNGIYFLDCQDILVEDNTIVGGEYGISFNYALDFSTIRNNTLINSSIFL